MKTIMRGQTQALAAVAAIILISTAPEAAFAQNAKAEIGTVESMTGAVTIKSIDPATRRLVVLNDAGEAISMTAPDEIRNFDQLRVGDKITATYTLKTEFVLSAPNAPLPPDTQTVVAARAGKGERPSGAVANQIVVTGAVVGIDAANHRLKIVSPQGGEVHDVKVTSADGLKAFDKVKVGDKITAYVSESLMLAANP
jgi:Cu/Ag efflux protein CusF